MIAMCAEYALEHLRKRRCNLWDRQCNPSEVRKQFLTSQQGVVELSTLRCAVKNENFSRAQDWGFSFFEVLATGAFCWCRNNLQAQEKT